MPPVLDSNYCNSLTHYSRLKTRVVNIGDVPLGGDYHIRIQSMTTTPTMDTIKTVEQCIRIIEAGGDYVRITAPNLIEAKNLRNIKNELRKRGYKTPLIADIHFTPNAAEEAARIVEKVRINPGNYADKKKFQTIEYTDRTYHDELERIREKFLPLLKVCKEYGTALRIGTNHGSLSDRIMSRYGDSPIGMVESALEFLKFCEEEKFYNIVFSMKASNPLVMVQAYRLLAKKMLENDRIYPLHLGVTEAGDGEDGRIKSAVGIGTLLEDGLGDTIRVSLTEEPELEIPVAKALVKRYEERNNKKKVLSPKSKISNSKFSPYEYSKRISREVLNIGGKNVPRVVADVSCLTLPISGAGQANPSPQERGAITPADLISAGYTYSSSNSKWTISDQACDYIFAGNNPVVFEIPSNLGIIYNYELWGKNKIKNKSFPLFYSEEYFRKTEKSSSLNFILVSSENITINLIQKINEDKTAVLIFETDSESAMTELRSMFLKLSNENCKVPVIIKREYKKISDEDFLLYSSTDVGGLFIDGFGDGLWLIAPPPSEGENCQSTGPGVSKSDKQDDSVLKTTHLWGMGAFGILQATRTRISKTEYISCPSCGRTLFDLQKTTQTIRSVTSHLKGIKIGIMGCIVNGPGEMADADYGYVGTGIGKVTLYKGKEVVLRNIPSEQAVNELIKLIKQNGDWVDWGGEKTQG